MTRTIAGPHTWRHLTLEVQKGVSPFLRLQRRSNWPFSNGLPFFNSENIVSIMADQELQRAWERFAA